jgi:hypothetical protein
LPYEFQHDILNTLQHLLEKAAFEFYQERASEVLEKKGWSFKEAGEWNEWVKCLMTPEHSWMLPEVYVQSGILTERGAASLKESLDIRHVAVHRKHILGEDVIKLARLAHNLLVAFDDGEGAIIATKYASLALEVLAASEKSCISVCKKKRKAEAEAREILAETQLAIENQSEAELRLEVNRISNTVGNLYEAHTVTAEYTSRYRQIFSHCVIQ